MSNSHILNVLKFDILREFALTQTIILNFFWKGKKLGGVANEWMERDLCLVTSQITWLPPPGSDGVM